MPFYRCCARRPSILGLCLGLALASAAGIGTANAQFGPESVALLDRLCAQTLRTNEEDRLYGMISLAVRGTIRYRGGAFRADVIDAAVQDALGGLMEDCPELTEADPAKRLNMAVAMISDATTKVLQSGPATAKTGDPQDPPLLRKRRPGQNTAADLSQQLSSQEIDQWLNSLPPRERALSLFLYSSDTTPKEVATALGELPGAMSRQLAAGKADLMRIYNEEWQEPVSGPRSEPAIKYTESGGEGFSALMKAADTPAAAPPPTEADAGAAEAPAGPPKALADGALSGLEVTGISSDLYAGWSLIATARDLPRGQRIAVTQPFLLEPNDPADKRMVVTGIAEIGSPDAETRRFLLKAYAIDADKNGAGVRDSFRVGGPLANDEAKKTLANPNLSSIEVARCLWHDFGTGPDPGLCRAADASPPSQPSAGQGAPSQ